MVSAALGSITGVLVASMYGTSSVSTNLAPVIPPRAAGWLGACSGLLVCLFWCRLILPLSLRRVTRLRSTAGLAGLGAGVLMGIVLNFTLMITAGNLRLNALAIGIGIGAPAGLFFGVIGGQLCRIAVTTQLAFRLPRERRTTMYGDIPHEPDYMEQLDVRSLPRRPHSDFRDEYDA